MKLHDKITMKIRDKKLIKSRLEDGLKVSRIDYEILITINNINC